MTTAAPDSGTRAPAGAGDAPAAGRGRAWLRDLVRSAAAPMACGALLIGLLSAWVAVGGAGTVSRVPIQVTRVAVPMSSFTARADTGRAGAYLMIRNLSASADELIGASSPAARRVILTRHAGTGAGAATGSAVPGLAIPAHGIVTLSPFGSDVVLTGAPGLMAGQHVALTLVFRHAGRITVDAVVTPPGTP